MSGNTNISGTLRLEGTENIVAGVVPAQLNVDGPVTFRDTMYVEKFCRIGALSIPNGMSSLGSTNVRFATTQANSNTFMTADQSGGTFSATQGAVLFTLPGGDPPVGTQFTFIRSEGNSPVSVTVGGDHTIKLMDSSGLISSGATMVLGNAGNSITLMYVGGDFSWLNVGAASTTGISVS